MLCEHSKIFLFFPFLFIFKILGLGGNIETPDEQSLATFKFSSLHPENFQVLAEVNDPYDFDRAKLEISRRSLVFL